jgi:LacI family transcriptional regulator
MKSFCYNVMQSVALMLHRDGMAKRPTLRDIAEIVGVSTSTVSRVLNDQPGIGAETRANVLAVAQEMRFVPNAAARSLATKRTGNIGFVTYKWSVSSRFAAASLDAVGINEEAQRLGYHVVSALADQRDMANALQLPVVRQNRVDGLVLAGPALKPSFILELYNSGLPIVLFDNALQGTDIDCVLHENELSTFRLTQHLIHEHAHKKIVFLSGPATWLSSRERVAGYRNALAGASLAPRVIHMPSTTVETGMEAMKVALEQAPELTAVVAVNDAVAIGAMRVCKAAGISIPGQMAVVGFDNIGWTQLHEPPLTTVHAYGEEMGRQAVRRLAELIELDPEEDHARIRLRVGTKLLIRRSCGCDAHE